MRKVPDAAQLKSWDEFTIRTQGISSWELMERASNTFCLRALEWLQKHGPGITLDFLVVCGTGNNGGDGLAIARMLHQKGFPVNVLVAGNPENGTEDFRTNLRLLPFAATVITESSVIPSIPASVVIDALFGSGLSRPVIGFTALVIQYVNQVNALRIAVDLPSGLMVDCPVDGAVVNADLTLTFQTEKLSLLLPETGSFAGDLEVLDIGLNTDYEQSIDSPFTMLERSDVAALRIPRRKFSHKGHYGHVLVVAGSQGKMGAAVLASKAALRTGCGWVTAHVPACGVDILQASVPEAMVSADKGITELSAVPDLNSFNAIAVGPGIGTGKDACGMLRNLLENARVPLVLDADALNILAGSGGLMAMVPRGSVLTPHPGEFRRLAGEWKDDFHRLRLLRELAASLGCWIILKGAHTAMAYPDGRVAFNTSGNAWMATAGSGDVLTGILVSLLAQGYPAASATLLSVFLHGRAGELASENCHPIVAGDLVRSIPGGWKSCFGPD